MGSNVRRYPMTPAVRDRMFRRIADRGERGCWRSWLRDQFYVYRGWEEALSELVESGRVERRDAPNRRNNGGHPASVIYFATKGGS